MPLGKIPVFHFQSPLESFSVAVKIPLPRIATTPALLSAVAKIPSSSLIVSLPP